MFFKGKNNTVYSYLIVGLGNPGKEYAQTRHNIGFMALDKLAENLKATPPRNKHKSLICEAKIGEHRVLLAKPQTYMNLSGEAVEEICRFYKIEANKVLIMFDDISLPPGKIRVRAGGTHGGHNGMRNISEHLATNDIARIKIGVGGKPNSEYDLKDWVLGKLPSALKSEWDSAICRAADAAVEVVLRGIPSAMNRFNG